MNASADAVMTIEELAMYLRIGKSTLYRLAQAGKVPGQKVGRHWRFHRATIEQWLARHPEFPAQEEKTS